MHVDAFYELFCACLQPTGAAAMPESAPAPSNGDGQCSSAADQHPCSGKLPLKGDHVVILS